MGVWEYGSMGVVHSHTPTLPHSHTPILPHSHTLQSRRTRPMTPDISLHRKLNEAARRIRLLLVSQWAARTLCWTAAACVVWLLASKLNWLPAPTPELVGGI